jgi:hypothetical protein
MTTTACSAQPQQLDLSTLNAAREVVTKALQNQVITWEQNAADAAAQGDFRSAQQYKEWVFALDLGIHTASMAVGALVLDTLDSLSVIADHRRVDLPVLQRSAKDLVLDAKVLDVLSEQPEPDAV